MVGTDGTIVLDFINSTIQVSRLSLEQPELIKISRPNPNDMYFEQMADFLRAVETGGRPAVPLEDGVAVLKIALSARRAAETGIRQDCQ